MTVITIRQMDDKGTGDSPNAIVSFDHMGQHPITISNPFSEDEEKRLEWYFEKYLEFPFVENVRADQAKESILTYGHALFNQIFQGKARDSYVLAREKGLENLHFEIIGSPDFLHQLHWETLKDPERNRPFVLESQMVRTTLRPPIKPAESQASPTINLLIVTARPNKNDVGYRTISKPLVESLRNAGIKVKIDVLRPGTYEALSKHLDSVRDEHNQGYYHIIHFDLHGSLATYAQLMQGAQAGNILFQTRYSRDDYPEYKGHKAFLFFETDKADQADPAEAQEVAELLSRHSIPIVVLNACQSAKLAEDTEANVGSRLMEAGVQTVVAMGYSVTVTAAALMMTELYRQLFKGQDLSRALCYARKALHDDKNRRVYFDQKIDLEDWMLPVVYQNGGALAESSINLREFTASEEKEYWQKQSRLYYAPETTYGFVGRDLDVLEVERRLLATSDDKVRNMLLIQGMGGSGKTTFLRHLMEWWQTTNFVVKVFYFGYDKSAYTASRIMDALAQDLLDEKIGVYRALDPASQRKMLGHKMRSEHHLLVLDNMESITGSSSAIKHTLKPEERQDLSLLLAELLGGNTKVLMGSRGSEDWLTEGEGAPLRPTDIYHLPGLDKQATTTLAERVLEKYVKDVKKRGTYRQSAEFEQLMKLLDGYPLPIQVVLANLGKKTPVEILMALKRGGVLQDTFGQNMTKDIMLKKTESIVLCIEYSYGNLDPDDQKLLMVLAPFTGVINKPLIENYIENLGQQPALKDLPFQHWPEVLQQAQDWGLITSDQMEDYLRLQPVLPYFLYTRLKQMPVIREAVETAYRATYDDFADELASLMKSRDAQEKQTGQALTGQEYENLYTALELSLKAKGSILNPYSALTLYLESNHDLERGLKMGQMVLAGLGGYPAETLKGPIGAEMMAVIDGIAARRLLLKQYAEAEAGYKRALSLSEGLTTLDEKIKGTGQAGIYINLGWVAQEQRQWKQAEEYYHKALKIYIEFKDTDGQANAYHQLGRAAQEQRQWKQAEEYYYKALKIFIKFKDFHKQAIVCHQLGNVAGRQRLWKQAEYYYQKALKIKIDFKDIHGQADAYHNLGWMAQEQRQWKQAEEYYHKALKIYIEFKDFHTQAGTYYQLGMVALEQGLWKQAEEYNQKALKVYIEFKDFHRQAIVCQQLGNVAGRQRLWKQAENYYQMALKIYIESKDIYEQADIYNNLGWVAQEQRLWKQAEEYYHKALKIYIEFKDFHTQAGTYYQLGRVAWEQGHGDTAQENALKALEIFVELGDQQSKIALGDLALLWQATTDQRVPAEVARVLKISQEDAKKLLDEAAKR